MVALTFSASLLEGIAGSIPRPVAHNDLFRRPGEPEQSPSRLSDSWRGTLSCLTLHQISFGKLHLPHFFLHGLQPLLKSTSVSTWLCHSWTFYGHDYTTIPWRSEACQFWYQRSAMKICHTCLNIDRLPWESCPSLVCKRSLKASFTTSVLRDFFDSRKDPRYSSRRRWISWAERLGMGWDMDECGQELKMESSHKQHIWEQANPPWLIIWDEDSGPWLTGRGLFFNLWEIYARFGEHEPKQTVICLQDAIDYIPDFGTLSKLGYKKTGTIPSAIRCKIGWVQHFLNQDKVFSLIYTRGTTLFSDGCLDVLNILVLAIVNAKAGMPQP